ncbi:hypothetical protein ACTHAM_001487 [Cellulomonas soli]|uniref:hypothetical protein n=1 Tax=Cellulomonas soli TaxID=931535 RepID=UPI003F8464BA
MHFSSLSLASDGDDPAAFQALLSRHNPPENEAGAGLGGVHVLARTESRALLLSGVRVYASGLALELELRLRVADVDHARHHDLWESVQQTWVGVALADGTRVVAQPGHGFDPRAEAGTYALTPTGGGGGGRSFQQTYWLTPAPPPGDVLVVVANPLLGLPEGRHTLPAAALAEAAAAVVVLWPWEPDPPVEPDDARLPSPPPGGWFAEPPA